MRLNTKMMDLFQQCSLDPYAAYLTVSIGSIWMKTDTTGRPYWGTGSFCGLDRRPILSDTDLSRLEWDGNEVHLSAETEGDTASLLVQMMGILTCWKKEMSEKYADTSFNLTASYDDGQGLVYEEDDQPIPSVTLRFWAERGTPPPMDTEHLDRYAQPVLLLQSR